MIKVFKLRNSGKKSLMSGLAAVDGGEVEKS
jgi:hypothetical protein